MENWNAVLEISFRFVEGVVKVEVFRIGVIGRRVLTLTAGVCFRVAFGVVKVTVTRNHIHIIREAGVIPETEIVAGRVLLQSSRGVGIDCTNRIQPGRKLIAFSGVIQTI